MNYINLNPTEFNKTVEKELDALLDETFKVYSIPASMVFKKLDTNKYNLIKKHYVKLLVDDIKMTSTQLKELIQSL